MDDDLLVELVEQSGMTKQELIQAAKQVSAGLSASGDTKGAKEDEALADRLRKRGE